MARDGHDRLVRDLRLSEARDRVMPQIVEAETGEWTPNIANIGLACPVGTPISRRLKFLAGRALNGSDQTAPRRSEAPLIPCWIHVTALARGKDVMLRFGPIEVLCSFPQTRNEFVGFMVHRNQSLSGFGLTRANQDHSIKKVHVPPL